MLQSWSPSALRSARIWSSTAYDLPVVSARAASSVIAQRSRIRVRRRASSEMVLARPRPRTRSRVAWTSSRTPGRDSSAPSSSTVSRWVSRPTRCSSGSDRGQERLVGAGGHPQLERGGEHRTGEVVGEHLQHRAGPPLPGGEPFGGSGQVRAPDVGQVLDGGHDQVVLGREVVQLGAPGHPGPLGHQRGRRMAEAALDQAVDGRLQQAGPHRAGALLLGNAGRGAHPPSVAGRTTNSQA